jgi:hypothetical protein
MVPPKENYGSSIDPFTDIMVNEVSVMWFHYKELRCLNGFLPKKKNCLVFN